MGVFISLQLQNFNEEVMFQSPLFLLGTTDSYRQQRSSVSCGWRREKKNPMGDFGLMGYTVLSTTIIIKTETLKRMVFISSLEFPRLVKSMERSIETVLVTCGGITPYLTLNIGVSFHLSSVCMFTRSSRNNFHYILSFYLLSK